MAVPFSTEEPLVGPAASEIRHHLQRVMTSPAFRASKRCQQFLSFVTEETLNGNRERIKERTLAIEVFGRSSSWDASADTIVRVGAREVRKRLAQYYGTPEGSAEPLHIDLPSGAYVPDFRYASAHAPTLVVPVLPVEKLPPPPAKRSHKGQLLYLLLATAAAVLVFRFAGHQTSVLEQFWKPVWSGPGPALVGVADPIVYLPSSRAWALSTNEAVNSSSASDGMLNAPSQLLHGDDFVPNIDQFVGFGDAVAAANFSALVAGKAKDTRMRLAGRLDFADLRESPAYLIGAYTNRWTMELTGGMRYHFARDKEGRPVVVDRSDPHRIWGISKRDNGGSPEDYFLICRLVNSPTGRFTVVAAGITQFGTQDAGQLLANSDRLAEVLRHVEGNWRDKNLQIVLHAKIVENSPGPPDVVASYVW